MQDGKELLNKVQSLKETYKEEAITKVKGVYTAAMIGAALGFLYAYSKKYNLLTGAIVGAGVAALAGHLFLPSKDEYEDE